MVSRCQHRWLWRGAHSEGGQGIAACHHEIADACLLGTVLDASGTLLDEQVRKQVQREMTGCVAVVQRRS